MRKQAVNQGKSVAHNLKKICKATAIHIYVKINTFYLVYSQ